ncbi:MAG: hypothetical protein ACRD2L_13750 [Terriglobia bacterium]
MKVRLTIEDDAGRTYHGQVVLVSRHATKSARKKSAPRHASGDPRTPAQALKLLHTQGIFKTERTLRVVETELAKMDCNFPKASLAKALERADFLTRRGTRGNYRWIQRFKPGA